MEKNTNCLRFLFSIALVLCLGTDGYGQYSGLRDQVTECYLSQVGVRELTGRNDGKRVQEYLKTTGLQGNYAWCGAFVNWVYKQSGVSPRAKYPARARSWFSQNLIEPELVQPGDLFALYYHKLGRIGHVGFIHQVSDNAYITVEGNTNQAGSREGDGVWRKRRMKRSIYQTSRWIKD